MWKMQIVTDNLHFLCLLKSYDAKYGKMKTTASIPSNEGENRMKKCKILALMLSISMAMGQMGPMTVMAAEQNASSEAMNTVAYEEGWLDVESANDWDAEWYWGSETSGINNDSEMWWGDSEVVEYSEESEVESDDAAVYQRKKSLKPWERMQKAHLMKQRYRVRKKLSMNQRRKNVRHLERLYDTMTRLHMLSMKTARHVWSDVQIQVSAEL